MKKKLWLALVCAALSLTCFLFGCEKGSASSAFSEAGNIVGYVDETETVAYGSAYVLETLVRDDIGTIYDAAYTVTDSSGAEVAVERGKFLVLDKSGYTVVYSVTTPKSTFSRTVTLTVVNGGAPAIEMSATDDVYMFGESYTVPEISVYDYYDGEITEYTVEFFRKSGTADEKYEDYVYSPEQPFPLTQSGDHYMKVTAKNSAGTVAEARKEFFVREEMLAGEYDCFSDSGCLSTSRHMASVSARNWHETYKGKQGVLSFNVGTTNAWRNLIHVTAKGDKTSYADYEYIAVSMYIQAEEGAFSQMSLFPSEVGDFALENIVYNRWKTYYFPNNIVWIINSMNLCGTTVSPATVYIDGIFFANSVEVSGGITEENDVVTIGLSAEDATLDYEVYFGDESVPTSGNTFTPTYYGEYTIYPIVRTPFTKLYTGSAYTYTVTGAKLIFNEYDETVVPGGSYVAPEATVCDENGDELTGFETSYTLLFSDYAGNTTKNVEFDPSKKGVYTYRFTAEKDGKKVVGEANVKTGTYLDGEIFNVSDLDAIDRTSAVDTKGDVTVVSGAEIDAEYAEKNFLRYEYTVASATNTTYFNFAPSATIASIVSAYDVIRTSVYPGITLADGAEMPAITLTFMGKAFTLTANQMNEIDVSLLTAILQYAELDKTATTNAYAFRVDTTMSNFDSFTLYVGDVTAATVSEPETKLLTVNDASVTSRFGESTTYREYSYFVGLGLGMAGDYTGNAVTRFFCDSMSVTLDLTKDDLALFKGKYNAVKFNLMLMNANVTTKDMVNFTNFTFITHTQAVWNFNTWYEITVGIDDVIAAMKNNRLKLFAGAQKSGLSPTYCFGDIELTGVTETHDSVLVAANADGASYYTNSKAADSLSYPVSGKYDETLQRIVVAYDGNAGAANAIFLTFDDSAEQLQAVSERYGYTHIKFTFMVNAAATNTSGKIKFSGLFGTLNFAATETEGYRNYRQEYELTVSVAEVIAAMNACTVKQNTLLLLQVEERTGGSPTGFCFGNVEFVA